MLELPNAFFYQDSEIRDDSHGYNGAVDPPECLFHFNRVWVVSQHPTDVAQQEDGTLVEELDVVKEGPSERLHHDQVLCYSKGGQV